MTMLQRLPHFLAFLISAAVYLGGGLDAFDNALMDLRFRIDTRPATDQVVLVEINESSLQRLDTWPWPRDYHARLVERLSAAGAGQIVLDIDFSSFSDPAKDERLAAALAQADPPVILPTFKQTELDGDGRVRLVESVPIQKFRDRARLATFNVRPDADGIVRRMVTRETDDGQDIPHFAALVAQPADLRMREYYVDFGIDMRTISRLSYADVLEGQFDPSAVAGKLVLVGATAVQLGDMIAVPVYRSIPGITLQALAYQSLAEGSAFRLVGPILLLLIAATLALVAGPVLQKLSWRIGLAAVLGVAAILVTTSFAVQTAQSAFAPPALWLLTLVLSYLAALFGKIDQQDIALLLQGVTMRRRAAFMKLVVDNSFDAMFTIGSGGEIRTANRAAEDMFCYPAAEMTGKPIDHLFLGPVPPEAPRDDLLRLLQTTGTHQVSAINAKGASLHLDLAVSRMSLNDEDLLIVTARDVTGRRLAERVARRALQQLRDSIDNIPEGFALFGADDRLVLCNDQYQQINAISGKALDIGCTYESIQAALANSGVFPDAAGRTEDWLAARMAAHRDPTEPVEQATSDGRWLLINEHKTRDGGTIVIQTDISDLKTREQEMGTLLDRFAQVAAGVAATTTGVVITAPRREGGNIVFVNPAFATITGYTEREAVGRRFEFLLGSDADAASRQTIEDAVIHYRAAQTIIRSRRKNGTEYWGEVNVNPVKDESGRVAFFVWIISDVTERVHSEKALVVAKETAEVSNRSKTEFLHNMSHELRTPLNAIIGFSEVMLSETFGPLGSQRYADYAHDIHESGRHLLEVINDVLDIAKIEAGRFELTEEKIVFERIVEAVVRLVRERAVHAQVQMDVAGIDHLPAIRADGRIMKQVLLNLVDNAIKFTPAGGNVFVRAGRERSDDLWITVADTGVGIPPHLTARVMEPFVQADSALSRKYEGTGLGLPLAKRFVEMHGGRLTLESRVGAGTKVTIHLPNDRVLAPRPEVVRISTRSLAR